MLVKHAIKSLQVLKPNHTYTYSELESICDPPLQSFHKLPKENDITNLKHNLNLIAKDIDFLKSVISQQNSSSNINQIDNIPHFKGITTSNQFNTLSNVNLNVPINTNLNISDSNHVIKEKIEKSTVID